MAVVLHLRFFKIFLLYNNEAVLKCVPGGLWWLAKSIGSITFPWPWNPRWRPGHFRFSSIFYFFFHEYQIIKFLWCLMMGHYIAVRLVGYTRMTVWSFIDLVNLKTAYRFSIFLSWTTKRPNREYLIREYLIELNIKGLQSFELLFWTFWPCRGSNLGPPPPILAFDSLALLMPRHLGQLCGPICLAWIILRRVE